MKRLNNYEEQLVYGITKNTKDIDGFIKLQFEEAKGDSIKENKLRNAIGELISLDFLTGIWADDVLMCVILLENIDLYVNTFPELCELSNESVLSVLTKTSELYKYSNILPYMISSCGQSQIGWEQIDQYEWRFKLETFDTIALNKSYNYIIDEFNQLNYCITFERAEMDVPRKKKFFTLKHKSLCDKKESSKEENTYLSFGNNLLNACLSAQAFRDTRNMDENGVNTYIRDILKQDKNFKVHDQTLRGDSYTGKSYGELDIFIETIEGTPFSIIEALKLESLNKEYIKKHIDKIFGYDTAGLKNNYILIYSQACNFKVLCDKYFEYIRNEYCTEKLFDIENIETVDYSDIVLINSRYLRHGKIRELKHIIVNMS